jgi:hypothetical protein
VLQNFRQLINLSKKFRINEEDILLIAVNSSGVRSSLAHARMRFRFRLRWRPEEQFRLSLPLGRSLSPFELREDALLFNDSIIADVDALEDDDSVIGYFRKNEKVLTLNSNVRSSCTGCVFCPNLLEGPSDPRLAVLEDLSAAFSMLQAERGWTDFSHLEEVNLCTGCFLHEKAAIDHLITVRRALEKHHSKAQIGLLASVVTSEQGFNRIASDVGSFHLVLTIECFTNRDAILKHTKARLTPDMMPKVLASARESGLDTDFTYIVGLDSADVAVDNVRPLVAHLTRFPNFQVFQPHNNLMDQFVARGANDIEYYLDMRLRLEELFRETRLRPLSWENYRPLWYFTFAGEALVCERT